MEKHLTAGALPFASSEITLTLKLLYRFLYVEPDRELIAMVTDCDILPYWQEKMGKEGQSLREYLAQDGSLDALQADHLALFVGIGMPLAPPWRSVYLDEENLLLRASTYAWMEFLKQQKLTYVLDEKQPQDHIGLMLSVLATLWQQYQQAVTDGGDEESVSRAIRIVLGECLLTWQSRFCQLVGEHAQTPVYQLVGQITEKVITQLAMMFQVTSPVIKLHY